MTHRTLPTCLGQLQFTHKGFIKAPTPMRTCAVQMEALPAQWRAALALGMDVVDQGGALK